MRRLPFLSREIMFCFTAIMLTPFKNGGQKQPQKNKKKKKIAAMGLDLTNPGAYRRKGVLERQAATGSERFAFMGSGFAQITK